MKYIAATLLLAASALAAPGSEKRTGTNPPCKFGTYRCTASLGGIEICDVTNKWQLVGPCGKGEVCQNLPQNGFDLPFCVTKKAARDVAQLEDRNGRPGQSPGEKCQAPGKYDCFGPYAIQVCDTQNVLQFVGNCPQKTHCDYLNGIPYCVESK